MVELERRTFQEVQPERSYLGMATYLQLDRFRTLPAFLWMTKRVPDQVARSDGAVGYRSRARLLPLRFWTLSVWEDDDALEAFVGAGDHADVMASLDGELRTERFARFTIRGTDLPPAWPDAVERLGDAAAP